MSPASRDPDWERLADMMKQSFETLSARALDNLRQLLESARDVLHCTEAGLLVPTEDGDSLRFLASANSSPEITEVVLQLIVPCDRSIAGYVFSTGQLVATTDPAQQDRAQFFGEVDAATGLQTVHYLAVPLIDLQQTLGVVTFLNRPPAVPDEPFDAQEILWSQGIAKLVMIGLQHYRRLTFQEEWAKSELAETAAEFGVGTGGDAAGHRTFSFGPGPARSPLIRAFDELESLPEDYQELAADLIERLAIHRQSNETNGGV